MTSHRYRAMRTAIESLDDSIPGTFEITREGIVHDLRDPSGRHELTLVHDWRISTDGLPRYDE